MCACLLLAGCTGGQAEAAVPTVTPEPTPVTLRVSVGREGSTIDPTYVPESDPADYLGHLFEGLMKYAPAETTGVVNTMEIVPGLAESVETNETGLVYRFTLRGDALWSDGQPVTAADFVYAWQRLLQVGQSPGAAVLEGLLAGCYAESDRVLVAELTAPCPYFLKLCAAHYMVPLRRDIIERYGGDWTQAEHIVVSGPYTIQRWVHDDTMTLMQNPCYYDRARLGPEVIEWRFGPREDSHVTVGEGEARLATAETYFLYLNTGEISDWRVRAAMVLAVDREELAQEADALPATGLVPPGITLTEGGSYVPGVSAIRAGLQTLYPAYDLNSLEERQALARQLMEEARAAGTRTGEERVYYRMTSGQLHRTVGLQCMEDWRKVLGISVTMVEMEEGAYARMLDSGDFHAAYLRWLPDYDDPMSFLQLLTRGGGYNYSGWGEEDYDRLLEAADGAMGAERDMLLARAEAMLFQEGSFGVCPLLWMQERYTVQGVAGVGYSAVGEWRFQYATAQ